MKYNLNKAAADIAMSIGGTTGVRRTYGGADNDTRMHITWQVLKDKKPYGMIFLLCEDGMGRDGMEWHGEVSISAPGVDYYEKLLTPLDRLKGRKAKRITRQRFVLAVNRITRDIKIKKTSRENHKLLREFIGGRI